MRRKLRRCLCPTSIRSKNFHIWLSDPRDRYLYPVHTLSNISRATRKDKKKKNRSPLRTFMNMQSWSTLHGLFIQIAGLRKKVRACTLGYPAETCREICMHGSNLLLAAHARCRPDKKCIFGFSRRTAISLSSYFSVIFHAVLAFAAKSRGVKRRARRYKYKLQ